MISSGLPSRQRVREAWTMERLLTERSITLGLSLDASTNRAYSSHLNSYLNFCHLHQFPVEPTPDILSFYVTYMSQHINPRSVETYLSGIVTQLEPFFPHVRDARRSRLVTRTLKGALRRFGRPVKRVDAMTCENLLHALSVTPAPFTFDDLLFLSQLLTGFFGLLRLGELTWPDAAAAHDYRKLVLRHTVIITSSSYQFELQTDKSDHLFQGNSILIHHRPLDPDPYSLFIRYLRARDHLFPLHPHLWLTSSGLPPTRSWFLNKLKATLPSPSLGGHSMRAGGATFLAASGVAPAQIQAIGRWRSDTWERYIRTHPTLLQSMLFPAS